VVVRVGGPAQYSNDGGLTWHWFGGKAPDRGEGGEDRGGPSGGSIALAPDGGRVVWAPGDRGLGAPDDQRPVRYATRQGDGWSNWTIAEGAPARSGMVVADLAAPGTFYLRAREGFFASTDGGATWSKLGDLPDRPNWLRAIPGKEGHLWLAAGDEGKGGLHRSTDGGKTWNRVAPDVITVAKQVGIGAPKDEGGYPALFVGGTAGDLRGFFRSDDEGKTWVRVNDDAHHYGNVTVINGDARVHGRLYVGTNGRGILYAEPAAKVAPARDIDQADREGSDGRQGKGLPRPG